MVRVLVIASCMSEAEAFGHAHPPHRYSRVQFRFPANIRYQRSSLKDLFQDCCQVITDENIVIAISCKPSLLVVQAALKSVFDHLAGPSFESCFLLCNRFYNRQVISKDFCYQYTHAEIYEIQEPFVDKLLKEQDTCIHIKSCYAIQRDRDIVMENYFSGVKTRCREMKRVANEYSEFCEPYLDTEFYFRCSDHLVILEEYPATMTDTVTVRVEGEEEVVTDNNDDRITSYAILEACVYSSDDIFVPWNIGDHCCYEEGNIVVELTSFPCQLSNELQSRAWAVFRDVSRQLAKYQYRNAFLHAKVSICQGIVRIEDMYGGTNVVCDISYMHVLLGGDSFQASIDALRGLPILTPKQIPERSSISMVITSNIGARHTYGDLLNLAETLKCENLNQCFVHDIESPIERDEPLATFTFNYSTYDNCMRHLVKTTDRILVHEDLSAKYPQMDAKQPEERRERKYSIFSLPEFSISRSSSQSSSVDSGHSTYVSSTINAESFGKSPSPNGAEKKSDDTENIQNTNIGSRMSSASSKQSFKKNTKVHVKRRSIVPMFTSLLTTTKFTSLENTPPVIGKSRDTSAVSVLKTNPLSLGEDRVRIATNKNVKTKSKVKFAEPVSYSKLR